jgi:hypothetical protein
MSPHGDIIKVARQQDLHLLHLRDLHRQDAECAEENQRFNHMGVLGSSKGKHRFVRGNNTQ